MMLMWNFVFILVLSLGVLINNPDTINTIKIRHKVIQKTKSREKVILNRLDSLIFKMEQNNKFLDSLITN